MGSGWRKSRFPTRKAGFLQGQLQFLPPRGAGGPFLAGRGAADSEQGRSPLPSACRGSLRPPEKNKKTNKKIIYIYIYIQPSVRLPQAEARLTVYRSRYIVNVFVCEKVCEQDRLIWCSHAFHFLLYRLQSFRLPLGCGSTSSHLSKPGGCLASLCWLAFYVF
jgi:hypothetical protein